MAQEAERRREEVGLMAAAARDTPNMSVGLGGTVGGGSDEAGTRGLVWARAQVRRHWWKDAQADCLTTTCLDGIWPN